MHFVYLYICRYGYIVRRLVGIRCRSMVIKAQKWAVL